MIRAKRVKKKCQRLQPQRVSAEKWRGKQAVKRTGLGTGKKSIMVLSLIVEATKACCTEAGARSSGVVERMLCRQMQGQGLKEVLLGLNRKTLPTRSSRSSGSIGLRPRVGYQLLQVYTSLHNDLQECQGAPVHQCSVQTQQRNLKARGGKEEREA